MTNQTNAVAAALAKQKEEQAAKLKEQAGQDQNKSAQQQDNSAEIAKVAQQSESLPSANQMTTGLENANPAPTLAQIQAQLEEEKTAVNKEASKDVVRFAAFRNTMRNVNQLVKGQKVTFFNHEAYVQVNKKNEQLIAGLMQLIEDFPEIGITQHPVHPFVDINPAELEQQRKQAELNLFLADRGRRQAPVTTIPDQLVVGTTTGMKGENTGSFRFKSVEPQK